MHCLFGFFLLQKGWIKAESRSNERTAEDSQYLKQYQMSGIHPQSSGHQRAYAASLSSHRGMLALLRRCCCPCRSSHGSGISKMLESLLCFTMTFPWPLFGYPELLQVEEPELSSMLSLVPGSLIHRGYTFTHGLSWLIMGRRLGCFWCPTACLLNQLNLWHSYMLPPSVASTTYRLAYRWTIDSKETLYKRFCINNAVIFLIIGFQHQLISINCTSRAIFLITTWFSYCCWPEP